MAMRDVMSREEEMCEGIDKHNFLVAYIFNVRWLVGLEVMSFVFGR